MNEKHNKWGCLVITLFISSFAVYNIYYQIKYANDGAILIGPLIILVPMAIFGWICFFLYGKGEKHKSCSKKNS